MSITNISNKQKTIKDTYASLPADNFTIDKFIYYCYYNNKSCQVELGNILDNYRDYFDQFLVEVDVPKTYYYQPAYFAEYYYGTPDLDFLVLYFSKITTMFDFVRPRIKVLPNDRLLEINSLMVKYAKDVQDSYNNPTEYMEDTYLKI